jgi:uncharacterized protein
MAPEPRPAIRYLDGTRFRRALIAGARRLMEHRDAVNAINVFPVADADTGSNMAGTLGYVVDGVSAVRQPVLGRMLRSVADLALEGARGCSGTILAQFFHGLAQEFSSRARLTTRSFGQGVGRAVTYPWEAVSEPREGTILTVLRDWGRAVQEWSTRTEDFGEMLTHGYTAARNSLAGTTDSLPALRRAGVVDAGAQGLVHMLGGITGFIATGRIRDVDAFRPPVEELHEVAGDLVDPPTFRFCCQFVLEGTSIDLPLLRGALAPLGDSLIAGGTSTRAKIHLHSDQPALAFQQVARQGTVTRQHVEDMAAQFRAAHTSHQAVALVVDSSCDLPDSDWQEHALHVVPCLLSFNDVTYMDKLTITPQLLFSLLRSTPAGRPTTSQPALADFRNRYDFLLAHHASVVSLSLSSAISGTYDAARGAAAMAGPGVSVVDTKSASIGLGILARRAAEAVEAGAGAADVVKLVEGLLPRLHILFTVPNLVSLVRSGRVSRAKGFAAGILGLTPVIRLDAATGGRLAQGATVRGVKGGRVAILRELRQQVGSRRGTEFGIAHANAAAEALWFRDRIVEEFAPSREPFIVEATSVLAAHIGEGAVGLAYLLPEDAG